jgi:hypothetical protein
MSITTPHCKNPFPPSQPLDNVLAIYPPTSTQHDGFVCNLINYIEKEYISALISYAKNIIPYIDKWLFHTNIHIKWSNLLWDASWIIDAQIMQTLKSRYGRYLGYYPKSHILKQDIPPTCDLCTSHQNNICLHLLSCCTNKHINNLRTNKHNKVVHTLAKHTTSPSHNPLLYPNQRR